MNSLSTHNSQQLHGILLSFGNDLGQNHKCPSIITGDISDAPVHHSRSLRSTVMCGSSPILSIAKRDFVQVSHDHAVLCSIDDNNDGANQSFLLFRSLGRPHRNRRSKLFHSRYLMGRLVVCKAVGVHGHVSHIYKRCPLTQVAARQTRIPTHTQSHS
jgi:hypothetical protein